MLDTDISTNEALALLHRAETDPWALDRRRFLQLVAMGAGAGLVSGPGTSLLDSLLLGHDPSVWAAGPVGLNDGILVVVGLFGGNDGLNTVVPLNDGLYYDQHGPLALAPESTLPLAGGFGLNPGLSEFKRFWDAGQLAIVNGVGYPNADLSHFNSMAYWMSGRIGGIPTTGWLGRWLDGYLGGGRDLYAAAEIGHAVPLHLVGAAQRGTVVPPSRPTFGTSGDSVDVQLYQAVRSMQTGAHGPWHAAVNQAFIDQIDLAATIAGHYPPDELLPETEIVAQLEIAARMINANLGFRVLTAGFGDFDSHANQPGMHTDRMSELNAAIARFFAILDPGWAARVTVMTFSEFGRTSWANDGAGTDHGSAAPQFVLGANVRGGFYGQHPSLAGLDRWDRMPFHVDLRSYYTSIIDGWLGGGAASVLGGTYENLGLFARGPGIAPDGGTAPPPAVVTPRSSLVAVSPTRVLDTRDGTGGVLQRPLQTGEAIRVPIAGVGPVPASGVVAVVANVTAVEATAPTYFTVYPGRTARPRTSNLNPSPGRPVPNLVVMGLGSDGTIEVFNRFGDAHCLVDVYGYFVESGGQRFSSVAPFRLFDTREGLGVRAGKVASGAPVDVQVTGVGSVPAGATAVVMNLTVTEPDSPGWARLRPAGPGNANTSNINFAAGDTVPNLVMCKIGDGGRVSVDVHTTGVHVLGDVFGYFSGDGRLMRALPPGRVLDTRDGTGVAAGKVGPGREISLAIAGRAQVPAAASAVVLNVTATNVDAPSYVTVWPEGRDRPGTSNLNVMGNGTIANLVVCQLGDGALRLANPLAECDLIADVLGYFID